MRRKTNKDNLYSKTDTSDIYIYEEIESLQDIKDSIEQKEMNTGEHVDTMIDTKNNNISPIVEIIKLHKDAIIPKKGTSKSCCFDIYSCFYTDTVEIRTRLLDKFEREVMYWPELSPHEKKGIFLDSQETAKIPTGLLFNIPENYKLLLYPRSGISLNKYLVLANTVGIIDEDYVEQLFVLLKNTSEKRVLIAHQSAIAQLSLEKVIEFDLIEKNDTHFVRKTERTGGFGHTDVSN